MELKLHIKNLWEECFEDSPQFLDFYFQYRYEDKYNHFLSEGDEVIAAMQVFPYQLKLKNQQLKAGYIYGACTARKHRNQGAMGRLMLQVMQQLYTENYDLLFLIPASASLYHFYSKFDFYTAFYNRQDIYENKGQRIHLHWEKVHQYIKDDFQFIAKREQEKSNLILHGIQDYQAIIKDITIADGAIYRATDKLGNIVAIALLYPEDETRMAIKGFYSAKEKQDGYISDLCHFLSASQLTYIAPSPQPLAHNRAGMLRILHPETLFKCSTELNGCMLPASFYLEDNALSTNNMLLGEEHSKNKNAVHLSMIEYTAKLFESTPLYMNWMMD